MSFKYRFIVPLPRWVACFSALLLALLASVSVPVSAQDESKYPTGPGRVEKVVEEMAYFYNLKAYQPAVPVRPVVREQAAYDTPEDAAIATISAMVAGDYDWFLATWTPDARRAFEQRNTDLRRGADFWTAAWQTAFGGDKSVELTHRVETGAYVLIAYTIVDPAVPQIAADEDTGVRRPFLTAVLVEQEGRWLSTQDLAADPVLMFWDRPGHHVEKMGRNIQ